MRLSGGAVFARTFLGCAAIAAVFFLQCNRSRSESSTALQHWAYLIPESLRAGQVEKRLVGYGTICLGVYRLNAQGALYRQPALSASEWESLSTLRKGRRLLPLISLRGARDGAVMLRSVAARRAAAAALSALVVERGYDGLHIDFEYLHSESTPDFARFLSELKALNAMRGKSLSIAAFPPLHGKPEEAAFFDMRQIGPHIDGVVYMTYDYHLLRPGPVTHLGWVRKNIEIASEGFDRRKIWMGVPLYGYEWRRPGARPRPISETQGEALCRRYACQRDESGVQTVIGGPYPANFADRETRLQMTALAEELGLRGVAMWRIGFESH